MSRLSEIHNLPELLAATVTWKQTCLENDGSIFSNDALWSVPHLQSFHQLFAEQLMAGQQRFMEKPQKQLEPAPPEVKELASEMLWLFWLFHNNVDGDVKAARIIEVWNWPGDSLASIHMTAGTLLTADNTGPKGRTRCQC